MAVLWDVLSLADELEAADALRLTGTGVPRALRVWHESCGNVPQAGAVYLDEVMATSDRHRISCL